MVPKTAEGTVEINESLFLKGLIGDRIVIFKYMRDYLGRSIYTCSIRHLEAEAF